MSTEEEKNSIDIFAKIDNNIDQNDVINILVAKFEANTEEEIKRLQAEIRATTDEITQKRKEIIEKAIKSSKPEYEIEYPIVGKIKFVREEDDPVSYGFVPKYDKNGKRIEDKNCIEIYYMQSKETTIDNDSRFFPIGVHGTSREFPSFKILIDVDVTEIKELTAKEGELMSKLRENRVAITQIEARTRQLKAQVSLKRLENNKQLDELLGSEGVKSLISAPSNLQKQDTE